MITSSTPKQISEPLWYQKYIPEALVKICAKSPTHQWYVRHLNMAGFRVDSVCLTTSYIALNALYDRRGPHKAEFRALDSTWALVSATELRKCQAKVDALTESEWKAEVTNSELKRKIYGLSTHFIGHKVAPCKITSML